MLIHYFIFQGTVFVPRSCGCTWISDAPHLYCCLLFLGMLDLWNVYFKRPFCTFFAYRSFLGPFDWDVLGSRFSRLGVGRPGKICPDWSFSPTCWHNQIDLLIDRNHPGSHRQPDVHFPSLCHCTYCKNSWRFHQWRYIPKQLEFVFKIFFCPWQNICGRLGFVSTNFSRKVTFYNTIVGVKFVM